MTKCVSMAASISSRRRSVGNELLCYSSAVLNIFIFHHEKVWFSWNVRMFRIESMFNGHGWHDPSAKGTKEEVKQSLRVESWKRGLRLLLVGRSWLFQDQNMSEEVIWQLMQGFRVCRKYKWLVQVYCKTEIMQSVIFVNVVWVPPSPLLSSF